MIDKHTPGPWVAHYSDYGDELWFGGAGCGLWSVGPCYLGGEGRDQSAKAVMDADARLISAAPDLLEALEKALADAGDAIRVDGMMLDWMDAASAAIAKARGADFAPRSDDVGQSDA